MATEVVVAVLGGSSVKMDDVFERSKDQRALIVLLDCCWWSQQQWFRNAEFGWAAAAFCMTKGTRVIKQRLYCTYRCTDGCDAFLRYMRRRAVGMQVLCAAYYAAGSGGAADDAQPDRSPISQLQQT